MSSDPADVGRAPEDVPVAVVEHVAEGGRRVQHVASGRVDHAFWFPRRPAVGGRPSLSYILEPKANWIYSSLASCTGMYGPLELDVDFKMTGGKVETEGWNDS